MINTIEMYHPDRKDYDVLRSHFYRDIQKLYHSRKHKGLIDYTLDLSLKYYKLRQEILKVEKMKMLFIEFNELNKERNN